MGMVGTIISTLAMGYMQGKAQQDQYNAMARQADANAQISELNARKAEEAAREQDKANKINEENEHRRNLLAMSCNSLSYLAMIQYCIPKALKYNASGFFALRKKRFSMLKK